MLRSRRLTVKLHNALVRNDDVMLLERLGDVLNEDRGSLLRGDVVALDVPKPEEVLQPDRDGRLACATTHRVRLSGTHSAVTTDVTRAQGQVLTDTRNCHRHDDDLAPRPVHLLLRATPRRHLLPNIRAFALSERVLALRARHPREEPLVRHDDALALGEPVELLAVALDLRAHPPHVRLRLRTAQLALRHVAGARALAQQRLCHLAPVAVHQVQLVELDVEEERGPRRIRRGFAVLGSGSGGDVRAHDEALDRLPVPLAGLGDLLGEGFDFGDGVQDGGRGRDEAPLVRKGIDDGRQEGEHDRVVWVEGLGCILAWTTEGVAQSVGEHDERELHGEPQGGEQLICDRGRSIERLARDDLVAILIVNFHPRGIAVETLSREDLDPTGRNPIRKGELRLGPATPRVSIPVTRQGTAVEPPYSSNEGLISVIIIHSRSSTCFPSVCPVSTPV